MNDGFQIHSYRLSEYKSERAVRDRALSNDKLAGYL